MSDDPSDAFANSAFPATDDNADLQIDSAAGLGEVDESPSSLGALVNRSGAEKPPYAGEPNSGQGAEPNRGSKPLTQPLGLPQVQVDALVGGLRGGVKTVSKAGTSTATTAARFARKVATKVRTASRTGAKPLTTRKREVPSDFNIVAGTYDTLVTRNPGYLDHLGVSASRLGFPNGGEGLRLLDLCCGTGLSTEALLKAFPKATVVGLDASSGMLGLARLKPEMKAAGVRFVLGDAMDPRSALDAELGETGAQFDGVLMAYGIRNMPDPDACLAVLHSVLKPGAPICFHEYSVADSPRAKGTWSTVAWGIIIPSGLITSRHTRIYRYLWRSVMDFDGKKAFENRLRAASFVGVHTEPMDGWQKDIVHSFLAKAPSTATSTADVGVAG